MSKYLVTQQFHFTVDATSAEDAIERVQQYIRNSVHNDVKYIRDMPKNVNNTRRIMGKRFSTQRLGD